MESKLFALVWVMDLVQPAITDQAPVGQRKLLKEQVLKNIKTRFERKCCKDTCVSYYSINVYFLVTFYSTLSKHRLTFFSYVIINLNYKILSLKCKYESISLSSSKSYMRGEIGYVTEVNLVRK